MRYHLYVTLPDDAASTSLHSEVALSIARAYVREATVLAESYGGDLGKMVGLGVRGHPVDVDNAVYALERWSGESVDLDEVHRWRRYRMSPRIWGVGIQHDPGGWHVTLGRWVWTTEVRSG